MRRALAAIAVVVLITVAFGPVRASAAAASPAAAGRYVVVLKGSVDGVTAKLAGQYGADHLYTHALHGFSAQLSGAQVAALRRDPRVSYVEPDAVAHMDAQKIANGVNRIFAPANANLKVGDGVDDRVDADVAVLDTGIDFTHPDLNVVRRVNCLNSSTCTDNAGTDDNGHGSNVAGIVGAIDNGIGFVGVAPGTRLWSVKVLDSGGSGNESGIVAGIDWVAAHVDEIEVANMSLGFNGDVQAVKDALNNAIAKGVVMVVSAGNNHRDVSNQTPANVPDAITVSSLSDSDGKPGGIGPNFGWCNQNNKNKDDTLSDFSNFGAGVDITAPGDCIESTWKNGGYSNYSGTSQAAPHVAGAAAWLTTNGHKPHNRTDVLAIRNILVSNGNVNWTDTSGDGVKEPLLDLSRASVFPPAPINTGFPIARFTATCSNDQATCSFDASASSDSDGTISSYAWDFGDGTTGTGKTASHTYARSGYYSVGLSVTDNSGNLTKTRKMVKAGNVPPVAVIKSHTCNRGTCSFDGTGSYDPEGSTLTYTWNFGDGTSATGIAVSHTYPAVTKNYTVTLTVTDDHHQTNSASTVVNCYNIVGTALCFSF